MHPNIPAPFNSGRSRNWLRLARTVFAMTALLLHGNTATHASEKTVAPYRLQVRPSICVSYDSTQPCTMTMEVTWKGETAADVCLRGAMLTPMLRCWKNAREGNIALDYSNMSDRVYQLVEEATQGVLAQAQVKVINRDLRSSRKRRRHVWSIL
jgi:DUF3019 family protein